MFCPSCGNEIKEDENFCLVCGAQVKEIKNTQTVVIKNSIMLDKGKKFILQHRNVFMIVTGCFIIVLVGILLFYKLYDFTKLSWGTENSDYNVTHTMPTTLTLNVLAYDKENNQINDIQFASDGGEIICNGSTVEWHLPEEAGTYTITAEAPSGKKITKEVKVILVEDDEPLAGMIEEQVDEETTDSDNDGLVDAKEKELGTNPYSADSDADGLPDQLEIEQTQTDPLNKDTDNDGINDGDELDLGLDPLKIDSKGDGIKDGERILSYSIEDTKSGVSLQITGKGNIASSTIDTIKNSTFSNMNGVLDVIYNFYTTGTIESAMVTIDYNLEDIVSKGLEEENLTLYYFNEETKELEALDTTVDKENKQIRVMLKHFSKYVIGDSNIVLANYESQIMFVIDNSVSMYSMTQMIEAGYAGSTGAIGNDVNFKRLTLTTQMIEKFTGNYQFGIAEFSGNYVNLSTFTNNTDMLRQAVNSMKSNWNSNANGTNIITALKSGIGEFKKDENSHYIVLLTDGKNTEGSLSSNKNTIINSAKEKDVKICVISLGNDVDTDVLEDIALETGCAYYNATDSDALDEIYSIVGADINYNLVDTDADNLVDGMIRANSGFIVTRDGFSFRNFVSNKSNGNCYGMAAFAMLYYTNQLPLTLEAKDNSRFYLSALKIVDLSSNGYDLSNTYFATHGSLYDYKITNPGLKLIVSKQTADFRDRVEDDTWMIKEDYYNRLASIGATFYVEEDVKTGNDFSKRQKVMFNLDSDLFKTAVSETESELMQAIWRLFILQTDANNTAFSLHPDRAYEELYTQLNEGTPLILNISTSLGAHAINAIRLIQDIEDANKFKIEVYDNNYPGQTRYIEVTRNKYSKIAWNYLAWINEYNYTFQYDMDNDGVLEDCSIVLNRPIVS